MSAVLAFRVFGEAVAKGSMKTFAFQVKDPAGNPLYRNGKPVLRSVATHDNPKTRDWQLLVKRAAADAIQARYPHDVPRPVLWEGPIRLSIAFYFVRPQSLPKKVVANIKGLDVDKCARLIADSLSGTVYRDDRQIVELIAGKFYAAPNEPAHCDIRVEPTAGLRPADWPVAPAPLFQEPLFAEGEAR